MRMWKGLALICISKFLSLPQPNITLWFLPTPVSTNLPVMVWIYGGAFLFGGGQGANFLENYLYAGEEIAVRGNVIVVTFSYRVGPLGFLSTGDASAPGTVAVALL